MNKDSRNIVFVSTTLSGGGAERVMSYIINYLAEYSDWHVTLLLLKDSENNYINSINSNVTIERMRINGRIRHSFPKLILKLLKLKPEICFVGLDTFNKLFSPFIPILHLFGIRVVVRETNVLSAQCKSNILLKLLYKYCYNKYDKVIAQSLDMRDDLCNNWSIDINRVRLINNPVDTKKIVDLAKADVTNVFFANEFNFVYVGRLSYQKGLDILIQRISELEDINFHLYIIGEGSEYDKLVNLVNRNNLNERISFLGYQSNPYSYIKQADALILPSRYEGFPNVLLEANTLGKPVFSNNCPGGINEIVKSYNGIVADFTSSVDFKKKLTDFMNKQFDSEVIRNAVSHTYSFETIMPEYLRLFEDL